MLIRCQQCQALFSLQDGVAGAAGSFKVECGRCRHVFEISAAQGLKTPPPQHPVTPAPGATVPGALERKAAGDALARALKPRRPGGEPPPPPRRRVWPWLAGVLALGALAFVSTRAHLGGVSRASQARIERAQQKLLRDDLASLQESTALFTEAARLSPGEARPEAERAFALLLQAATHQDLARRIQTAIQSPPAGAAAPPQLLQEKVPHVGSELRLVQEGLAAARAALEDDREDPVALRALALHAALTGASDKGAQPLEQAARLSPGDPWISYTRAALLLSGQPSREKQDGALAALAVARQTEPRMLRAQVEVASISLDRGEAGPARLVFSKVLQENPKHERAQRLLSLLPPTP
jgi:predicted Zn finger-like uncharacterized protein